MYISSAASQNSVFGLTNQKNTSNQTLVGAVAPVDVVKAGQEKLLNKQSNQRIVTDEKAIALFEKSQLAATAAKLNVSSSTFSATDQDKPSTKNEIAVASYQSVDNLAQRESVQQLFGVDLFA